MPCKKIVTWNCSRQHRNSQPCGDITGLCRHCDREDREIERKRRRDLKLDIERDNKKKEYIQHLTEVHNELEHLKRLRRDKLEEEEEQEKILQQHRDDIEQLKNPPKKMALRSATNFNAQSNPDDTNKASISSKTSSSVDQKNSSPDQQPAVKQEKTVPKPSPAKDDWEYQKSFLNAQCREVDTIMSFIGLESVKAKFMAIKDKVDTSFRQNIDLKNERFGCVLLGNPGTGKTTVARLYAGFLASMGIIPENAFEETTGSSLANAGVSGCQKIIDKLLNAGGGVLFIDEAYQLVQGGSFGGTQVLDFLLAEVENRTGKIVFILAGYQRLMEKFFSHNPGLPSRFPHELKFHDYDDNELLQILEYTIKEKVCQPANEDRRWRRRFILSHCGSTCWPRPRPRGLRQCKSDPKCPVENYRAPIATTQVGEKKKR